jgi:hypothetical protein
MAAGIKVLRKVQVGNEGVTPGVVAPATTLLVGTGTLEDTREVIFQTGDVGLYAGSGNTRTAKWGGKLEYEQEASFEQLPILLSASVDDVVTGAADGGGSGHIYDYEFANTAPQSITTWSLEGGDNIQSEVLNYGYVPSFNLTGKGGEPVMAKTTWQGAKVAVQAYTSGVLIPTVEAILFSRGSLAIDDSGDTIGATPVSNTFLAMDLKVETGWIEVYTADGLADPTFSFLKQTEPNITLDITFEHEANSIAEKANWRNEVWRKLRLKFEGSALGTGATYTKKTLIIDLMGKWTKFDKLDEQDGNDIIHGIFQVKYSDAAGDLLSAEIIVINEIADITA